jgi:hypothetical protein
MCTARIEPMATAIRTHSAASIKGWSRFHIVLEAFRYHQTTQFVVQRSPSAASRKSRATRRMECCGFPRDCAVTYRAVGDRASTGRHLEAIAT